MKLLRCDDDFSVWRGQARQLLLCAVPPHAVSWEDVDRLQLFAAEPLATYSVTGREIRIPALLLEQLEAAARYRMSGRWNLLYRILWRVVQGERHAALAGDADGSELHRRLKSVSREAHHMHAFLRFHPCLDDAELDYIAWHEPAHDVLAWGSEHFAHRLGRQKWLIATPHDGVRFDGEKLDYQKPCPLDWQQLAQAVRGQGDKLWETYYSSIFNPARLNPKVMQGHMPLRFWAGIPEGKLIQGLVSNARAGSQKNGQAEAVAAKSGKVIGVGRPRSAR